MRQSVHAAIHDHSIGCTAARLHGCTVAASCAIVAMMTCLARADERPVADHTTISRTEALRAKIAPMLAALPVAPASGPSARVLKVDFGPANMTVLWDESPHDAMPKTWLDLNGDGDARDFSIGEERGPILRRAGLDVFIGGPVSVLVSPANAIDPQQPRRIVGKVDGVDRFFIMNPLGAEWDPNTTVFIGTPLGTSSFPGATTIALWEGKQIHWRIEQLSGVGVPTVSIPAGASDHDFYFRDGSAGVSAPTSRLFFTAVDVAIRNANGLTANQTLAVAEAIFTEFQTRSIVRRQNEYEGAANPRILTYYEDWDTASLTLQQLLATGDGTCAAWCDFFMACCHIAGVDPDCELVRLTSTLNPNVQGVPSFFFVDTWDFKAPTNPHPTWSEDFPWLNLPCYVPPIFMFGDQVILHQNNAFCKRYADVDDLAGVAGQGPSLAPNPLSLFGTHYVVLFPGENGKVFDPSYGTSAAAQTAEDAAQWIEDSVVAGYSLGFISTQGYLYLNESEIQFDLNWNNVVEDLEVYTPSLVIQKIGTGEVEMKVLQVLDAKPHYPHGEYVECQQP